MPWSSVCATWRLRNLAKPFRHVPCMEQEWSLAFNFLDLSKWQFRWNPPVVKLQVVRDGCSHRRPKQCTLFPTMEVDRRAVEDYRALDEPASCDSGMITIA